VEYFGGAMAADRGSHPSGNPDCHRLYPDRPSPLQGDGLLSFPHKIRCSATQFVLTRCTGCISR